MNITDCLAPERVRFLSGATKAEAVTELLETLCGHPAVTDGQELVEAIWRREALMSTGIGMGIAVPHARLKSVQEPVMAIGIHRQGLADYDSIDGEPVRIIALIAAGAGQHTLYIRLLAQMVEVLKDAAAREQILNQQTTQGVFDILTSKEDR